MSEYQYYEFRSLDRRLTKTQMDELRALSTRATITPTSFVNVYHYGDFRGDPHKLMEGYFDAFLYIANWGTRWLMFRLPKAVLDPEITSRYRAEENVQVRTSGDYVIVAFRTEDEEGRGWEEGEGWLDELLPIRADLEAGDLRALYVAWLAYAAFGPLEDDEDEFEPPVPPGLGQLSPPLEKLVEFLRIDADLLAAAASRSAKLREDASSFADMQRWIHDIPESEKDALLLRLMGRNEPSIGAELQARFRKATTPSELDATPRTERRTLAQLCAEAEAMAETRRRTEAERSARQQAEREKKRATYLDDLATRQDETWQQIDTLIATKSGTEYDEAVRLLGDLRDVATRTQTRGEFQARLRALRARHSSKSALLRRIEKAEFR